MQTYQYAKCGASVIRDNGREQCGKLPAEHGTERRSGKSAVTVAHSFVFTGK